MNENLDELKSLVATIAADRQAQKDKEKREAWTKFVSLSMIVLAVLGAIATQRGAGYSSATMKLLNEATFNQANASDQWAYYQAKGIKQSIQEEERDRLANLPSADPKALASVNARIERYDKERKEITAEAKRFEAQRDLARQSAAQASDRGREMGLATTAFQIAIALGGIALVMKERRLWFISLLVGVLAFAQMLRVLWM